MPCDPKAFQDGTDFRLLVRVLPADVPGALRVRRLLKGMLRALHLRCLSIEPADRPAGAASATDPTRGE